MQHLRCTVGDVSGHESVGQALLRLRKERAVTGTEVAAEMTALGHPWSRATVSTVESGRRNVSVEELAALCEVMGVPVEALVPEDVARSFSGRGAGAPDEEVQAVIDTRASEQLVAIVARRLGRTPDEIEEISDVIYGMSLVAYRDRIVEQSAADVWGPAGGDVVRARGHATRQIIAELREHFPAADWGEG
jgi:transcriptional regulator with XRE-family HTH domain